MIQVYTTARWLIMAGALLVVGALNHAIVAKEQIKRGGETVYLALAPVDPRSLMQGDYMTLRFELADALEGSRRGTAPSTLPVAREGEVRLATVALDARGVAQLAAGGPPEALKIRYRIRNGRVWLGTNAFFFEEGDAKRFEPARFGEFRVDRASGEAVLVGLRDGALKTL